MILNRYIGINMIKGWFLVMLVLGAVFFLINFTQELERTYQNYSTWAAAR